MMWCKAFGPPRAGLESLGWDESVQAVQGGSMPCRGNKACITSVGVYIGYPSTFSYDVYLPWGQRDWEERFH